MTKMLFTGKNKSAMQLNGNKSLAQVEPGQQNLSVANSELNC